jgi:hypothetical protein
MLAKAKHVRAETNICSPVNACRSANTVTPVGRLFFLRGLAKGTHRSFNTMHSLVLGIFW